MLNRLTWLLIVKQELVHINLIVWICPIAVRSILVLFHLAILTMPSRMIIIVLNCVHLVSSPPKMWCLRWLLIHESENVATFLIHLLITGFWIIICFFNLVAYVITVVLTGTHFKDLVYLRCLRGIIAILDGSFFLLVAHL